MAILKVFISHFAKKSHSIKGCNQWHFMVSVALWPFQQTAFKGYIDADHITLLLARAPACFYSKWVA